MLKKKGLFVLRMINISLHILEMDSRNEYTLRLFLTKTFRGEYIFREDTSRADLYIINMDSVTSSARYKAIKHALPNVPMILTSSREIDVSNGEVLIKNPVAPSALSEAFRALFAVEDRVTRNALIMAQEKARKGTHKVANLIASKQVKSVLERRTDMMTQRDDAEQSSVAFFDPKDYVLGEIYEAVSQARSSKQVVQLTSAWPIMTFFPETNRVYLELDDRRLQSLCVVALSKRTNDKQVLIEKVGIKDGYNTSLDWRCPNSADYQGLDAFLWKVAVWTARGRAIKGMHLDKPIYFKEWPNLTRFICPENTLAILALWLSKPHSIEGLADKLNLPIQNILTLYAAASALELVGEIRRSESIDLEYNAEDGEPKRLQVTKGDKSLFARLLKKLLVG